MPYRSERSWSGACSEFEKERFAARAARFLTWACFVSVCTLGVLPLFSFPAQATITVEALNGGKPTGNTFWYAGYAANAMSPSDAFVDSTDPDFSWQIFNLKQNQSLEDEASRTNMIQLKFSSNFTAPSLSGDQKVGLALKVYTDSASAGTTGASSAYVPITAYGLNDLSLSDCGNTCLTAGVSDGGTRYYAVPISSGNTISLGFYVRDLCESARNLQNVEPVDCDDAGVDSVGNAAFTVNPSAYGATATSSKRLYIKAQVIVFESLTTAPKTDAKPLDESSSYYTLSFQNDAPALSSTFCRSMESVYFPGDGKIYVQTGNFSIGLYKSDTASAVARPTDRAPLDALLVLAKQSSTVGDVPVISSAIDISTSSVQARVSIGGEKEAAGFTNIDAGGTPKYQVQFLVRDSTGLVSELTESGACQIYDVQTSNIQGFLNESKCFIATAAFGSMHAAPVSMLRRFRDSVLLQSSVGKSFVSWYYSWSPEAAEWLLDHPTFRLPVLLALVPLEVLAWLGLHPLGLAILAVGAGLVLLGTLSTRLRRAGEFKG